MSLGGSFYFIGELLLLRKLPVTPLPSQQFIMGPGLQNAAILKIGDLVCQ